MQKYTSCVVKYGNNAENFHLYTYCIPHKGSFSLIRNESHDICLLFFFFIDPFKLYGISHSYQLKQSIFVLRVGERSLVFFKFIQILIEHNVNKQWRP